MQTDRGRELEMTLQQLRYAIAVADNGSMNEAAKKLFISQPSLSGMIKDLEEELDIQIFVTLDFYGSLENGHEYNLLMPQSMFVILTDDGINIGSPEIKLSRIIC